MAKTVNDKNVILIFRTKSSKIKFNGIDRATFDFDKEFKNGYTPEEAKAESIRRIREWWGK